jgi:hypothetical protein
MYKLITKSGLANRLAELEAKILKAPKTVKPEKKGKK